jgi:hypothetical protein
MSGCSPVRVAVAALASPWLAGLSLAFLVAIGLLHDVADTLRRAAAVDARVAVARALLVADVAAFAHAGQDGASRTVADGVTATVARDAAGIVVETRDADGVCHAFVASQLRGAAPAAFGLPFAAVAPVVGASVLAPVDVPRLDARELQRAVRADATRALRRDAGIALLHWEAGTDGDDFVFAANGAVSLADAGDLLVVPGHLWVPRGERPLVLIAAVDCVIVVQGNLYLGRSLRVQGPGRVLIATVAGDGAVAFADRDGNGRWSTGDRLLDAVRFHGPIEGGGSVWCGHGGAPRIVCDAGLCVGGSLHLAVDTDVRGPLVLGNGIGRCSTDAQVRALGAWTFCPERERVPGFETSGKSRPGLLRPSDAHAATAKQTLYLARIGR